MKQIQTQIDGLLRIQRSRSLRTQRAKAPVGPKALLAPPVTIAQLGSFHPRPYEDERRSWQGKGERQRQGRESCRKVNDLIHLECKAREHFVSADREANTKVCVVTFRSS